MDLAQRLERQIAAGHAGLVGHDHDFESRLAQPRDGARRAGDELELPGSAQVIDFLDDDPVAVEENSGVLTLCHAGGGRM